MDDRMAEDQQAQTTGEAMLADRPAIVARAEELLSRSSRYTGSGPLVLEELPDEAWFYLHTQTWALPGTHIRFGPSGHRTRWVTALIPMSWNDRQFRMVKRNLDNLDGSNPRSFAV